MIYQDLENAERLGKTLIAVPIQSWKYCEKIRVEHPILKKTIEKLKSKLKIMEITFEQINNSRNDLLKQLSECETALEKTC